MSNKEKFQTVEKAEFKHGPYCATFQAVSNKQKYCAVTQRILIFAYKGAYNTMINFCESSITNVYCIDTQPNECQE